MTQTSTVKPSPTQIELIEEPPPPLPQILSEQMVPLKVQAQCVTLLAELLEEVVNAAAKGGENER